MVSREINTLAESRTTKKTNYSEQPDKMAFGVGTDMTDKTALRGKANAKLFHKACH